MRYTECPYSTGKNCPEDNRTCRHCVPDIKLRNKILTIVVAFIILILIVAGCAPPDGSLDVYKNLQMVGSSTGTKNYYSFDVYILEVDSCEYLLYAGVSKGGIIHKANCPNPYHR